MGARGWTAPEWPKAYGGGGLSKEEGIVLDQELRRTVLIYGNTRNNRILGAPLLVRLEPGSWTRLIEAEVQGRGANETQYKHKPLVADLHYLNKVSVVDLHDSATEPIVRRAA